MKADLRDFDAGEMNQAMEEMGEKPFRARQLYEWVHKKAVCRFEQMTNLSENLRERCEERFFLGGIEMIGKQVSAADGAVKYLFALYDRNVIESVRMQYKHGFSVCVSSQVGCRMGCGFCASAKEGLVRNLSAGEMLSQVYEIGAEGEHISHVVIMGMGEPLDNYDNVVKFIRLLSDEDGRNISGRNITLSTCGLPDEILRLSKEGLPVTFAVSLHAPDDEIRKQMMPVARRYSMEEVLKACDEYFRCTGRRVTFEYSMIDGVNDKKEHALLLAERLKGKNCHVNCIRLNGIGGAKNVGSSWVNIENFKKILEINRINVTIRRGIGSDIDAACGQLRKKYLNGEGKNQCRHFV